MPGKKKTKKLTRDIGEPPQQDPPPGHPGRSLKIKPKPKLKPKLRKKKR